MRPRTIFSLVAALAAVAAAQPVHPTGPAEPASPIERTRSFNMGFTSWPYDFTAEAQADTYDFIDRNADLVTFHHDSGVPWPEALEGKNNYSSALLAQIDGEVTNIRPGQIVYVSATPQSQQRAGELALYFGETDNLPLPPGWENRTFDDLEVILAYINWCRYLLDRFEPDYFAYGIESNAGFTGPGDPGFWQFLVLSEWVYTVLKAEYPQVTIFLTVQANGEAATRADFLAVTDILLDRSDIVGISTYPYLLPGHDAWSFYTDPNELPGDLLTAITDLAPGKPMAITETGYIAEDLIIDEYGFNLAGTPEWQADYLNWLLPQLDDQQALFLVWFVPRDYDLGLERLVMYGIEIPPLFYIWRDNGLLDGEGNARPGLSVWHRWLARTHTP
jgi:hypothetical protein